MTAEENKWRNEFLKFREEIIDGIGEEDMIKTLSKWNRDAMTAFCIKLLDKTKLSFPQVATAYTSILETKEYHNKTILADLTSSLIMYRDPATWQVTEEDKTRLHDKATTAIKLSGLFNEAL